MRSSARLKRLYTELDHALNGARVVTPASTRIGAGIGTLRRAGGVRFTRERILRTTPKVKTSLGPVISFAAFIATLSVPMSANADTIYAYQLNGTGSIRIVSTRTACSRWETKTSWNSGAGTVGPAGPAGPERPPGPPGQTGESGIGMPGCSAEGDVAVVRNGVWVCKSPLRRFVDNGDGTVTDNKTGLMWEKKTGTNGALVICGYPFFLLACFDDPHNVNNTYAWGQLVASPHNPLNRSFLEVLNLDRTKISSATCFANHCDWRIPNIVELQTILFACGSPGTCIDPVFGPTQASTFVWSSSVFDGASAWGVNFVNGLVNYFDMTTSHYVRAVRSVR
jgi:Protein of unknown function (DUF1566)